MNPTLDTTSRHRAARRRDQARGALAGGVAALLALAVMVQLRIASGVISLLDALADATLELLPVSLFAALLRLFGTAAKAWLLAGLLLLLTLLGAWLGFSLARATAGLRRPPWGRALWLTLIVFAILALFLYWAVGNRSGLAASNQAMVKVLAALGLALLIFGLALPLALALLRHGAPAPDGPPADPGRRTLLTRGGLALVSLGSLLVLGRAVRTVRDGERVPGLPAGQPPAPITPTERFYVISKNLVDPDRAGDGWTIRVDGLVERPQTFDLARLETLRGPDFVSTFNCISNPIGGPLISTARWTGAPLAAVLAEAGVRAGAVDVLFHARDGYTDSLPLAKAVAPETALIWAMNGEALPRAHGHPARIIAPGRYGIKNVKWLERIEVVDHDARGYWQQRGWTDEGVVKTMSRLDAPAPRGIVTAAEAELAGIAFAGDRGIRRVEVSTDGGDTWTEATITDRPSPLSWVIWRLPWQPTSGAYMVVVRATDGAGDVQPAKRTATLPDGATGWHEVVIGVT